MYQSYQASKQPPLRGPGQPLSFSTKNIYLSRKKAQDLHKDREHQLANMLSSSQVHVGAGEHATLQEPREQAARRKKVKIVPLGRNQARADLRSQPASMAASNEYLMAFGTGVALDPGAASQPALRLWDAQSQSLIGLPGASGNVVVQDQQKLDVAQSAQTQMLADGQQIVGPGQQLSQQFPAAPKYQNQLLATKNMERLRKGRAQSAVRRDHRAGQGVRGGFSGAPQTATHAQAVLGPLTNPNLLQAYNYQELMNSSAASFSTPSLALTHSANQGWRAPKGAVAAGGPERPTSAAVRPAPPRSLYGRPKTGVRKAAPPNYSEESAIYGAAGSSLPQQLHASAAHLGGFQEVLDTSQDVPSQGSVEGLLNVLNQYRNLAGAAQATYATEKVWKHPQEVAALYATEDGRGLARNFGHFQAHDLGQPSNAGQLKASRNSVGQASAGQFGTAVGISAHGSAKRLGYGSRRGQPSEAGSGVTRHTIASSEKRKFPLRPTTAQQRSRMAFASHGLGQQDSIEELAEKEMRRLDSQMSQANLSLALTNVHGNSHTRLSSGRTSQAGRARAKLSQQARNIYMSNNLTVSHGLDASSQLKDTEATVSQPPGGATRHGAAASQGPPSAAAHRYSRGMSRKQSVVVSKAAQHAAKPSTAPSSRQRPKTAALRRSHYGGHQAAQQAGTTPSYYREPSLTEADVPSFQPTRAKAKLSMKQYRSSKERWPEQKGLAMSPQMLKKSGRQTDQGPSKKAFKVSIEEPRQGSAEGKHVVILERGASGGQGALKKGSGSKLWKEEKVRPQTAQRRMPEQPELQLLAQLLTNDSRDLDERKGGSSAQSIKKGSRQSTLVAKKAARTREPDQIAKARAGGTENATTAAGRGTSTLLSKFATAPHHAGQSVAKLDKLKPQKSFGDLGQAASSPSAVKALPGPKDEKEQRLLRSFHNGMARGTKDYNLLIDRYIDVLDQLDEYGPGGKEPGLAGVAQADCGAKLSKASEDMKAIRFHCHNLVARDVDRLVDLKATARGEGGKGPENRVDLIQGGQVFCCVSLKGRKQPFRLYIRQNGQLPSVARFGDLSVCLSDKHKNPTSEHCLRSLLNPGGHLYLKDPSEWPEVKEQQAKGATAKKTAGQEAPLLEDDAFKSEYLYISFISERNCTLNLVCQFPNEIGDEEEKLKKKERTNIRSEKAIRAKFADFIHQQVQELSVDEGKRAAYFQQIQMLKNRLQGATLKPCDTDFKAYNVSLTRNLTLHLRKQSRARQEVDNRIEDAKIRRGKSEETRIEKLKFEMLKWELYRLRVEAIEDDYADFKRLQKKINQWLFILLRHLALVRIARRFQEGKAAARRRRDEEMKHGRICRGVGSYLLRKGATRGERLRHWVRGCLTFRQRAVRPRAQQVSAALLRSFLRTEADSFYMQKRFLDWRMRVILIQREVRRARRVRLLRTQIVDAFFDKELAIMIKHYQERSKKAKKLRQRVTALREIGRYAKQVVITSYMQKVAAQNLIDAIYCQANRSLKRGERGVEGDPDYGQLTVSEHRNIKSLMRNQQRASHFLFDGVKEQEAVGSPTDETLQISTETLQLLEGNDHGAQTQAGGVAAIRTPLDGTDAAGGAHRRKDSLDSAAGHDLMALDDEDGHAGVPAPEKKRDTKNTESKGKAKSSSKSRGGGKKGKKGSKKAKAEDDIELDCEIRRDKDSPGLNLFLPDRITMQMLVTRAAGLKDSDRPPEYEDVRPWIVVRNPDVHL